MANQFAGSDHQVAQDQLGTQHYPAATTPRERPLSSILDSAAQNLVFARSHGAPAARRNSRKRQALAGAGGPEALDLQARATPAAPIDHPAAPSVNAAADHIGVSLPPGLDHSAGAIRSLLEVFNKHMVDQNQAHVDTLRT